MLSATKTRSSPSRSRRSETPRSRFSSTRRLRRSFRKADLEGPLVDWKAKGHTVEFAGNETVDGQATYKLKVTLNSGAVRTSYIDVASHFEVRVDSTRQVKGLNLTIETTFTDHQKTSGVLFPRRLEIAAEGRPQRARGRGQGRD